MIQAIKAKLIVTPGQAPIRDSAVIIKNNIIEKIIPSTELKIKIGYSIFEILKLIK